MIFSVYDRKQLTGCDLYVRIFQTASLLPIVYLFTLTGYPLLISKSGVLSFLFELGLSSLPRAEVLALSYAYRKTGSELLVYFALLLIALLFGILSQKLLKKEPAASRKYHIVLLILIGADIILHLLPLSFNRTFGVPATIGGLIVRLLCLILILLDLRKRKNAP